MFDETYVDVFSIIALVSVSSDETVKSLPIKIWIYGSENKHMQNVCSVRLQHIYSTAGFRNNTVLYF